MEKKMMVGEEVVEHINENNALQEGAGETASLKQKGNFEPSPHQEPWQPIETAPKDGTRILAYWFGNDMPFISVIWWRGDKYRDSLFPWRNACSDSVIGGHGQCHLPAQQQTWRQGPTHWMPLPAPPRSSGRAA